MLLDTFLVQRISARGHLCTSVTRVSKKDQNDKIKFNLTKIINYYKNLQKKRKEKFEIKIKDI